MRFLSLLLFLLLLAEPTFAQISVDGAERDTAAIQLRQLLDRDNYLLLDRDTVLEASSRIEGDVVVVDARVTNEGYIGGSVAVIRGDFFIRPRATVVGSILVVDGGAYPSGLATTGPVFTLDPRISADLEVDQPQGYRLALIEQLRGILRIPGILGFRVPTYNRVDGLGIGWGGELGFGGDTASISILGDVAYQTERERLQGGVGLQIRPSFRGRMLFAASRSTRTNEGWIRGTFPNSLSTFLGHSDVRNYFESDEIRASIAALPPPPLIEGESYLSPRLTLRMSEDRSVPTGDVFSVLDRDEPWRVNPAIDEGVLGSALAGLGFGWQGITTTLNGDVEVEWAPSGIGDFEFAQLRATADYGALALPGHTLEFFGHVSYPIGSGSVPSQRWSFVGGPSTLPTFETGELRGDHVVFLRGRYIATFPWLMLPLVGMPGLVGEYAAGTAWAGGANRPPFEQNVGVGVEVLIFSAMAYFDPSEDSADATFVFGARLPAQMPGGL